MGKEVDLKEEDVYTCKFFPREFIENSLQFNNWTVFSITVDAVGAAMSHLLPTLEELTVWWVSSPTVGYLSCSF